MAIDEGFWSGGTKIAIRTRTRTVLEIPITLRSHQEFQLAEVLLEHDDILSVAFASLNGGTHGGQSAATVARGLGICEPHATRSFP